MRENGLAPDILSLAVCDQIITDRMTGKQSLIGLFSTVHAAKFPVTHPQLCVHLSMTDGHGKTRLTIRIIDADDTRTPVVQGEGVVDFKNPRAIANLSLQFHGLVFSDPGEYRVQILCEGRLLREARMHLVQAKRRQRPDHPNLN